MKYLIGLIVLLLPTYLIRLNIAGVPTTVLELLIYIVVVYGLFTISYSQMLTTKKRFWLPIGILLLAVIISTYIAPEKLTALGQAKAFFVDPILVFWLVICFLKKADLKWAAFGLLGSSTFVSIYSITQKILGHVASDNRVVGIFGYSPNYVALFLVPVIILFFAICIALISNKKYVKALIFGILTIINIYALILTGSRGGELAVLGGIIFYLICYFWKEITKKPNLKRILFLIIFIAIVGAAWVFRPNFQASHGRVVTSNNIRFEIWKASLELVKQNPILGVGLGNFQNAFDVFTHNRGNFPQYITPEAFTPHNIFLMFYLTTGILGITAFVWLLCIFYRAGFEKFNKPPSKIILSMMTGILFHGFVDAAYFKNDLAIIFWLIFASMILIKTEA